MLITFGTYYLHMHYNFYCFITNSVRHDYLLITTKAELKQIIFWKSGLILLCCTTNLLPLLISSVSSFHTDDHLTVLFSFMDTTYIGNGIQNQYKQKESNNVTDLNQIWVQ